MLQLVLMACGQKRDLPINHCKSSKKPYSGPQVKNLRGLSLVRASVSRVFKWMRRGYWLPINALRIMGRPCCTDTTICFCQKKSWAVGSLSLIHFTHLPFWTDCFTKQAVAPWHTSDYPVSSSSTSSWTFILKWDYNKDPTVISSGFLAVTLFRALF